MEFFDRFHLSRLVVFSALVSRMSAFSSNAQVIGIDDGDQVVCGDLFEDDGDVFGPDGGPYSNNNYVITLCPDQPGSAVSVEFVLFDLQTNANPNNNDVLYIYDGDDTNAPLVGAGTGNSYEGVTISGSLNNPTGCLTFFFAVNNGASGGNLGWSANLTCVTPCTTPTSSLVLTSPSAFPETLKVSEFVRLWMPSPLMEVGQLQMVPRSKIGSGIGEMAALKPQQRKLRAIHMMCRVSTSLL